MSRLLINTTSLKNQFTPVLNDVIDDLISACNIAENLDVPAGFSYHTYLKTLSDTIRKGKNNCVVVRNFINNSVVKFNSTSLELCDLFNDIKTVTIKNRNTIVK